DLPVQRLLRRVVASGPQAKRDAAARRSAMRGSFVVPGGIDAPAHVLLVDDVLTTGATASACAAALADAGAREIHLLTACRSFADRTDRPPGPRGSRRP
ncbi:MAG TPA: phosphoribosyltransferase family protein, partial [Actinomycetota bacterium]|nr:phosphoribosyltransferase family protein [Actinomycetota bacterium]